MNKEIVTKIFFKYLDMNLIYDIKNKILKQFYDDYIIKKVITTNTILLMNVHHFLLLMMTSFIMMNYNQLK